MVQGLLTWAIMMEEKKGNNEEETSRGKMDK
jgi:hypothetical protein